MATKTVEAIILSRCDYGEADRLLNAYSKTEGKIKVLAKGSRRIKSKMACHIEPFCVGKYFLAEGRTFYILAGAESVCSNSRIQNNIELYKDASYLCEILQLTSFESEPNQYIYNLTRKILGILPDIDSAKRKIILRYFEYSILSKGGYMPDYSVCKKCHKKLPERNCYTGNFEGFYCDDCGGSGIKADKSLLKVLRLFSSSTLEDILKVSDIAEYNDQLMDVTHSYLCDILPKIPNSENL
jgi:DNA repair protein RecO (recombination protein O)